jgi:hypothetical protein
VFGIRSRVVDLVAKLAEEPVQLVEADVYVADDVERPVVVAASFRRRSRSKTAASISSTPLRT